MGVRSWRLALEPSCGPPRVYQRYGPRQRLAGILRIVALLLRHATTMDPQVSNILFSIAASRNCIQFSDHEHLDLQWKCMELLCMDPSFVRTACLASRMELLDACNVTDGLGRCGSLVQVCCVSYTRILGIVNSRCGIVL